MPYVTRHNDLAYQCIYIYISSTHSYLWQNSIIHFIFSTEKERISSTNITRIFNQQYICNYPVKINSVSFSTTTTICPNTNPLSIHTKMATYIHLLIIQLIERKINILLETLLRAPANLFRKNEHDWTKHYSLLILLDI